MATTTIDPLTRLLHPGRVQGVRDEVRDPHNHRRSQPILRLPVDELAAKLILVDGQRSDVRLFLPPGEAPSWALDAAEPFLPARRDAKTLMVARAAIAALGVSSERVGHAGDLPVERQPVAIRLGSGLTLEGELRWVAPFGRQRTVDHLNDGAPHLELFAGDATWLVVKRHVLTLEELC
jgi:hypothetical protein